MKAFWVVTVVLILGGCHFCHEELQLIMAGVPVIGFAFSYVMSKIKGWLHFRKPHNHHTNSGDSNEKKSTSGIFRPGHSGD